MLTTKEQVPDQKFVAFQILNAKIIGAPSSWRIFVGKCVFLNNPPSAAGYP